MTALLTAALRPLASNSTQAARAADLLTRRDTLWGAVLFLAGCATIVAAVLTIGG